MKNFYNKIKSKPTKLDKNYEKVTAVVQDYHDYNEKPRF